MFCESRALRRAVALFVVPIAFGAACASKSDADLFDSTPKPFPGRPSAGGADSSGGGGGSLSTGGTPATGGSVPVPVPVPAKGGAAGADPGEAGAGEPGEPSGMGGAAAATGGMTGSAGKPAPATGGKTATGGAGGHGGESAGGKSASGGSADSTGGKATGGKSACEPEPELCDGVDNDCDGELDEDACSKGCRGFTLEGGRYMFCGGQRSETRAHESCRDEGMRLSWIESAEENAALVETIAEFMGVDPSSDGDDDQAQVRIGGSDAEDEGVWRWEEPGEGFPFWEHVSGGKVWEGVAIDGFFVNWADERPNGRGDADEDCVVLNVQGGDDGDAGQWNDIFCDDEYPFVCEQ